MKAVAEINNPNAVEISMTMTMPFGDWKRLLEQLQASTLRTSYPAYQLIDQLSNLVRRVEKEIFEKSNEGV